MKKTLLSVAFLLSAYFSVNAQQNISYETSEGYATGALNGQNSWLVIDDEDGGPGTNTVVVSTERHSAGSQAIKFIADEEDNNIYYDAFKQVSIIGTTFTITQDVYIDGIDEENGSDFDVLTGYINGENAQLTSLIYFSYQGTIEIMTSFDTDALEPVMEEVGTYEDATWYQVKVVFDTVAGTAAYYINNQLIGTNTLTPGYLVNTVGYTFGAYSTSAFADNVNIIDATAGLKQQLASNFSVSPNPATNIISIGNTANALINSATLTDINGRTVKTAEFAGIANAQVNISDLASGVYMLNISSDKGTATKKIVKN